MSVKPFVILTCNDARCGNFLIHHWINSLKTNVNLTNTDIAIIDYGLRIDQVSRLKTENIILFSGKNRSNIINSRLFDAKEFLGNTNYKQVLFVDSGDVIFQTDISEVFTHHPERFRVVRQDISHLSTEFHSFMNFHGQERRKIWELLRGRPVINAGVIFSPVHKFLRLCKDFEAMYDMAVLHLTDQLIINYLLYKDNPVYIDKTYNYMIGNIKEAFTIRNGIFYNPKGDKASIVHNTGRVEFLRPIANFGYGNGYNKPKRMQFLFRNLLFAITH